MNLLTDAWIPVNENGKFKHITLKDVLCRDSEWDIALPRNDMEMATLQLVICLTQVIFPPKNTTELKARLAKLMNEKEFDKGIEKFKNWFELEHKDYPFMQTREVKAKDVTPIQKLFIGLPVGKGTHAFFNIPNEIKKVCPSCAAIAIFNQASNCPSFGGGFKGSLRGAAPITTLVYDTNLRQKIWYNILILDFLVEKSFPTQSSDKPAWIDKISTDSISAANIGILKGLFWQPAKIELDWRKTTGFCDSCGTITTSSVLNFKTEKFPYNLNGVWPHPHSPRRWKWAVSESEDLRTKTKEKFLSFTTTAPAWTQLSDMLVEQNTNIEGIAPAAIIDQFRQIFIGRNANLIVGGYRTKQAKILERKHDMISISSGWDENRDTLKDYIQTALKINKVFREKTWGFGKTIGVVGLANKAEERFYANSEGYIHKTLKTIDWSVAREAREQFVNKLMELAWNIFTDITKPYQNEPRMIKAYVKAKCNLSNEFNKIKEG